MNLASLLFLKDKMAGLAFIFTPFDSLIPVLNQRVHEFNDKVVELAKLRRIGIDVILVQVLTRRFNTYYIDNSSHDRYTSNPVHSNQTLLLDLEHQVQLRLQTCVLRLQLLDNSPCCSIAFVATSFHFQLG